MTIVFHPTFFAAERASLEQIYTYYMGEFYLKPLFTAAVGLHCGRARSEMLSNIFVGCASTTPCGNFELQITYKLQILHSTLPTSSASHTARNEYARSQVEI
jgi:hypothetical protein